MGFREWVYHFLSTESGTRAMLFLDDELGMSSEVDIENDCYEPDLFYHSIPTYQCFKKMMLATCYFAATCPDPSYAKNRRKQAIIDISGEGSNAIGQIDALRQTAKRHEEEFGWMFHEVLRSLQENKGVSIIGGPSTAYELLDIFLLEILKQLKEENTPETLTDHQVANLIFERKVERKRPNAVIDGLIFQLAYLIKDWCSGKREGFATGYGKCLQPKGNAHPGVISIIVKAVFPQTEQLTNKQITDRLKALKKEGASIWLWPQQENFKLVARR